MIDKLIRFPYELSRLPLLVVDQGLSGRLRETSMPRVVIDRALGSGDKVVGALLRDPEITRRGSERLERSAKLVTADRLDREAGVRRQEARDTAAAGRQEAAARREEAQDTAAAGLQEADAVEARGTRQAEEDARARATVEKDAADRRAATRAESAEKRKLAKQEAADTDEEAARRAAEADLDEADRTETEAGESRADAERLSDLTEAKKQERKRD